MKRWILRLDWPLIIRLAIAALFIGIAIAYQDWLPALFALVIGGTGIYASIQQKGCGYDDNCTNNLNTP